MIDRLKADAKRLMDRTDELSLRERAMIFVAILVVLYILAANLVFAPLRTEQATLERQLAAKRSQLQATEQQIQTIVTGSAPGAETQKRARIETLQAELRRLDEQMATRTAGLVSPKEMARLLEGFMRQNRRLRVLKLESLPPRPLADGAETRETPVQAAGRKPAQPLVYSHGMQMEVEGPYLEVLQYLKALEGLPWKVFWGRVSFEADARGAPKTTVMIYTLSTREGWIGI